MRRLLRRLGRGVYSSFLPGGPPEAYAGAETFLEDVWRQAPFLVALSHTAMAGVFALLCPGLSPAAAERLQLRLMRSRFYPARVLGYALKGTALMAVLRDARARKAFLPAQPGAGSPAQGAFQGPAALAARVDRPWPARAGGWDDEADYVVVGSGAGGAAAASALAGAGRRVLMLEEGAWHWRGDFKEDLYSSVSRLFRGFGAQAAGGAALIPLLQGCCVGGSTVISGAIMHRLPHQIYEEWARDEAIGRGLPFARIEAEAAALERELGVRANLSEVLESLPASAALRRLGWAYEAMTRCAPGCQGSGRCLQGCPSGGKLSAESSLVPRALENGAELRAGCRALRVLLSGGRAEGVLVETAQGERRVRARKAVVLAAGVLHTPALLLRSGLGGSHVGRHFQCHLSIASAALFDAPVRELEGPPQGIETAPAGDRPFKLATQLVPPELLLARSPVAGRELARLLSASDRVSCWTGSVRSQAEGALRLRLGRPSVSFQPAARDLEGLRAAARAMAELFLELGATQVFPNVFGAPERVRRREELEAILQAPARARHFHMGAGHLFGTCRMAAGPDRGVVGPDFGVYGARGLYATDASVFPSNTGVNPQLAIMSLARVAAKGILEATA